MGSCHVCKHRFPFPGRRVTRLLFYLPVPVVTGTPPLPTWERSGKSGRDLRDRTTPVTTRILRDRPHLPTLFGPFGLRFYLRPYPPPSSVPPTPRPRKRSLGSIRTGLSSSKPLRSTHRTSYAGDTLVFRWESDVPTDNTSDVGVADVATSRGPSGELERDDV